MIAYIGDISIIDAGLLRSIAQLKRGNFLEFGCGASTQVLAKYKREGTEFISIDTSGEWIAKTKENLQYLGIDSSTVQFDTYDRFMQEVAQKGKMFDFIFDDGVDHLRREFAIRIWPYLSPGGLMAFHDTRRAPDFRNVLEILAQFQNEVTEARFNFADSNITYVFKGTSAPYDNWQITEKREPWMLGYGEIPEYYKEIMKNSK